MIKFEYTKVYNMLDAIRGMRNPLESWDKSDSYENYIGGLPNFIMGKNDLALAMKLSKAGNDHAKYLRQILVSVDIIAPEYWWKEMDTYKVGTVANSTSMMHTLGNKELTVEDFSFDEDKHPLVESYMTLINIARSEWIKSGKKKPSPEWRLMNQLMAIAFNYRRTVTLNYQVLKNIYHSRKNHRLSEWHEFCNFIDTLPYSELITLNTKMECYK